MARPPIHSPEPEPRTERFRFAAHGPAMAARGSGKRAGLRGQQGLRRDATGARTGRQRRGRANRGAGRSMKEWMGGGRKGRQAVWAEGGTWMYAVIISK
eukprot:163524-Chlamydomonas_euryale.AAC.3